MKTVLRRRRGLLLAVTITCAALGVSAPAAFAHVVSGYTVNGCSSVTIDYADFPSGVTDDVSELLYVDNQLATVQTASFTGPSGSDTIDFNQPAQNGDSVFVRAVWDTNGVSGSYVSPTSTLSGCDVPVPPPPPSPPTATIYLPRDNSTFYVGQAVGVIYGCSEGANGPGLTTSEGATPAGLVSSPSGCVGIVTAAGSPTPLYEAEDGGTINTSTPGAYCLTVTAYSQDNLSGTAQHCYTVVPLTYTGRAFDENFAIQIYVPAEKLNSTVSTQPATLNDSAGPNYDTGTVTTNSTSDTVTKSGLDGTAAGLLGGGLDPLNFELEKETFSTAPGEATADSQFGGVYLNPGEIFPTGAFGFSLGDLTDPDDTGTFEATSHTFCTPSGLQTSGTTTIQRLEVNGVNVVGGGGPLPSGPIPANYSTMVGGVKVYLNTQTPTSNGLQVTAAFVSALRETAGGEIGEGFNAGVAISGINGCSGIS
jgi:hypothetical protein